MTPTRHDALSRYPALGQLIAGDFRTGDGRKDVDVIDPTTGNVLGQYPEATLGDIDAALAATVRGFEVWRKMAPVLRGNILHKIANTMRARAKELAELVVLELGKPWKEAIGEVEQAAGMWEWAAEEGRRAYGRVIPSREAGSRQLSLREPIGPIAAFGSWNAPLITPSRKMAGALGAGCSVVMKASEEVPACALAIGKIAYECGLPEGALSILIGDPVTISDRLIDSPVIRGVTFTGSTRVGKMLAAKAVSQMKRPIMELGGHAPVLVFAGVDVEKTAKAAAVAKFRNSGQICVSPTRFFVERSIYGDFTDALAAAADALTLGCGFDDATTMGPLISPRRVQAIDDLVQDAVQRGMPVKAGGAEVEGPGSFYRPTVVADVSTQAAMANTEPFGPLAVMAPFDSYEEAITLANRLPFGLAAYVQTDTASIVNRSVDDLESGSVIVNGWRVSLPETPFGGVQDSGLASEGGIEGLQAFQNVKFAYLG